MKYLAIFLGLVACNFTPKPSSDTVKADVTANAAVEAVVATDSVVPPQYDAQHHLLRITKSDAEWKKQLSEAEYYVLRQEGTERAFTGKWWNNHQNGTYVCKACGLPLFSSETKFESGTGWPSFWKPIKPDYVTEKKDSSLGMVRTEVECARCGGHLGHVFDDGPRPTGLRYCMNSVSLDFIANH